MLLLPLAQLQALSRQARASTDPAEIEKALAHVLRFYGLVNFEFKYTLPFFRAVRCDSNQGFQNASRVSYPPPSLAKANRMNEAGHPVLYTSVNQYTPLEEIDAMPGDFVQVAVYKLVNGSTLKAGIVGELTQVQRSGRALSSERLGKELQRILTKISLEAGKSYVFTDSVLSSILRDPDASASGYVHSRVLSRLLFEKLKAPIEAIMYPSIAHEGAMNLAIKPGAADTKLTLTSTFVLRIKERYDYGLYDLEVVRRARGQHRDGFIDWL
jgi:RES domain